MSSPLDIALVVSTLITLTKGADLLLLEKHKTAIDRNFRRFYCSIQTLNPAKWITFLQNDTVQTILLGCGALVLLVLGVFYYRTPISIVWSRGPLEKAAIWYCWASLVYGVRATNFVFKRFYIDIWTDMPEWLLESRSAYSFALRYALLTLSIPVCLLLIVALVLLCVWLKSNVVLFIIVMIGVGVVVLSTPLLLYLCALLITLLPIFVLSTVLTVLAGLLTFLRGLCERILEYSKGVYAGLVLLVTVVLGLYELWSKFR